VQQQADVQSARAEVVEQLSLCGWSEQLGRLHLDRHAAFHEQVEPVCAHSDAAVRDVDGSFDDDLTAFTPQLECERISIDALQEPIAEGVVHPKEATKDAVGELAFQESAFGSIRQFQCHR
jgi:hypothetical protein